MVRFRKGAPGQRLDLKDPNKLVGPTVGPTGSQPGTVPAQLRATAEAPCLQVFGCPERMGDPNPFVTNIEVSRQRRSIGAPGQSSHYALGLTQPVPSLNALWTTTR